MKRIIISTKLKTTNIGNEALSNELIKLASEFQNDETQFKIVGRPFGLDKYTYAFFGINKPLEEFENIAKSIAEKGKKLSPTDFKASDLKQSKTDLLEVEGFVVKTEKYRRVFRNIRKFVYSFFLYSRAYESRLRLYKNIDYYLYSGAGEVGPTEFFLRQLLDLRVAQLMGVKTCAINQSVEFPKGLSQEILVHVYSKMHKIVVRGDISKKILVELGLNPNIIFVSPDTAFRTVAKTNKKEKLNKRIGINFTPMTFNENHVIPFLKKLKEMNYDMVFISNEPKGDRAIANIIHEKLGIPYELETLNYVEYANFINKFDFIICSRLHSKKLALVSGVPIIPIEGKIHKTEEVFKHVGYPVKAIKFNNPDFNVILMENVLEMEQKFMEIQQWIFDNISNISERTMGHIAHAID